MLLLHVVDREPRHLVAAGLGLTDQTIDVDDAGAPSFRGLSALGGDSGTTIITGAPEYLALMQRLVDALGATVVAVLLDDPSDTVGWFVHAPGSQRELVRQEGAIVADVGTSASVESGDLDEDAALEWFEQASGVTLPWPDGTEATLLQPA